MSSNKRSGKNANQNSSEREKEEREREKEEREKEERKKEEREEREREREEREEERRKRLDVEDKPTAAEGSDSGGKQRRKFFGMRKKRLDNNQIMHTLLIQ